MARAIIGCIVGYLLMIVCMFGAFTGAWIILGADRSFAKVGSWEVSQTWLTISFAIGFVAAAIGGIVRAAIAKERSKAPRVLAGIVLVLGLLMAIPVLMTSPEDQQESRPDEVLMNDAMAKAQQPAIAWLLSPLVSAIGVMSGARSVRKNSRESS